MFCRNKMKNCDMLEYYDEGVEMLRSCVVLCVQETFEECERLCPGTHYKPHKRMLYLSMLYLSMIPLNAISLSVIPLNDTSQCYISQCYTSQS